MEFLVLTQSPTGEDKFALTDFMAAESTRYGGAETCPACGQYIEMCDWLPPYRVVLETWGSYYGDFAFHCGQDFLMSDRFRQLYARSGQTGLVVFSKVQIISVKHYRKIKGVRPRYYRATAVCSSAEIDQEASGFEWEDPPSCEVCRIGSIMRWKRLVVRPFTWSGEDIFFPRHCPGSDILVTRRFAQWCRKNQIRNAAFIPADQYADDIYKVD